MTEAAGLAIAHALRPGAAGGLGRRRLELLAAAGNAPSNALARRLGFVQVGLARRAEPLADGTYDDLVSYDLLA
jgi:RimJ/RimL family protein N-acetyltransferase